jgi:hypothetical protein
MSGVGNFRSLGRVRRIQWVFQLPHFEGHVDPRARSLLVDLGEFGVLHGQEVARRLAQVAVVDRSDALSPFAVHGDHRLFARRRQQVQVRRPLLKLEGRFKPDGRRRDDAQQGEDDEGPWASVSNTLSAAPLAVVTADRTMVATRSQLDIR